MALQVSIKKKLGSFMLDVEFQAMEGVFSILGASGCGKSMTLKCIAGIETPDEGRIVLNDRVLFDSEKKINLPPQKRNAGYMFQDYALFPNMTVLQNVMTGMGKRPDREAAEEYLRRFHIAELRNHYPRQLSGGQKQRTAMARLIAQKPDIILLDEPFSALDSYLKWELEREMKEILKEENKITLFVSHNRDEVYRFSHEVGCIDRGKMEEALPVKEFFENPGTRTAAMLSGCKNISGAEPVDEHHILAKDWNCILTVERKIPESTRAVGIRAHSFSEKETGDNCFAITESRVQEEPFEWSVDFKPENCDRFLQWKFPKQGQIPAVPEKIYVHSRDILLLRE